MRKRKGIVAVTLAYIVIMTSGELLPLNAPKLEIGGVGMDKIAHATSYGVMTLLLYASFERIGLIGSSLLALSHGVIIEVVQAHLSNRSADIYDLIANIVGIFAVAIALALLRRFAASED